MMLNERVSEVVLTLYGKQIIKQLEAIDYLEEERFEVPFIFSFNSSWKMQHDCLSCGNRVTIDQNYDENESTFTVLKNVDSSNYSESFIREIATLFASLELIELGDVLYLNRTDFQYDFNFQRKSSADVTHYSCQSCKVNYLALIRIGFPQAPEKGIEEGQTGRVEVAEMVMARGHEELNDILCSEE